MTSMLIPGHAEIYNALPWVKDADKERRSRIEFDNFLDDFAGIVVEAGLDEIAGPFLLHRHFLVSGDTAVVERPEVLDDGTPALVARPEAVSPGAVPVRWEWQPEKARFHPLEYCTDPVAVSSAQKLSQSTDLLSAVGQLLESYDLQDLIGLTVLARSLELNGADSRYSELTFDGMSVITVEDSSSREPGIETAWAATKIDPTEGVSTKPQSKCKMRCDCAVGPPTGCSASSGHC